ncbi:fumarylacetoacetate hydrolase family protein [Microbacterium amylolyticum]|uniref:2-keto-4-pentenoate hydratase/2-oxohepta-3-ene-1,7-dioic acid hydratase in catechol pathway n=1 Tax=Microbacterium amylolyticum TaxID=936337 RepID=A0ABS4ZFX4_9MICO|nr:fumarylacetoacetate hydrolase family protein [Microbacterium amylolyticum]MBP2436175.1 2-keto-4-pentenoate hydratase/2-oxohepta-3-ene-1,7-dioic acid hydratase in catechol pathway [Microbacterium amylolyticum]
MRFAHVVLPNESAPTLVHVTTDGVLPVRDLVEHGATSLEQLLAQGDSAVSAIARAAEVTDLPRVQTADVTFAPGLLTPPSIMAVGLNYAAHAGELSLKSDDTPTVFTLWPNSLAGHNGTTTWSRAQTESVDYEAELGVVIGKSALNVSEENALDYVFGYTVVNDISARNIQYSEAQWCRCKSLDGFTPVGPYVVTADEIPDPQALKIWTTVNGDTMQDATTGQMIRSVAKLVSHLSQGITLLPGTLISTGSPGGSGYSRTPQVLLADGSVVTVGVEGIGELTTHCRTTP